MFRSRKDLESLESSQLAPFAFFSKDSLGRDYPEEETSFRTAFQRDRDRIIHSRAFRHMEYKTQVFVNHVGDYYRTRLTHTLEVAQIAKSIAKTLILNEDLTEAIALAHDIGHTPFGHAGEEALRELMSQDGGFEHNRQGLRVVEELEFRTDKYNGLNLTVETREGIIKHRSEYDSPETDCRGIFKPDSSAFLEAQIVNIADEIAYNNHDIDDGLKSGLIDLEQLGEIELWKETLSSVKKSENTSGKLLRITGVRELIGRQIEDVIETSHSQIDERNLKSVEDVRNSPVLLVFSAEMKTKNAVLKRFLYENLYQHYKVVKMQDKAKRFVQRLFESYLKEIKQLPPFHRSRIEDEGKKRVICDYIAGMTDRFAMDEYSRLFEPYTRL
ncbi:deoxyguanosinetriphosphate triphosphohydrolase [candidate division WOR-3 bacterium]|nr:deoxyguanosinetriphosphate triphosphohydrolase [candidate division WOR-3 bacterium]